jgi:hypothetical protein
MSIFTQYAIKETDNFNEVRYPLVAREIDGLQVGLRDITSVHKTGIVISLLKDHCIKTEWLDSNKQLASMLTSGSLQTSQLESLFDSCKQNRKFLSELETYIAIKLA